MKTQEIISLLNYLEPDERAELEELLAQDLAEVVWRPLPGPQSMAYHSEADVIGFGGAAGGGKLSPLDAKVLTPKGWREIGTLRVGDAVTDPTTGGTTTVIGVFPQGVKDIYRVAFDDGASIEVGIEHLWAYKRNGNKGRRPRTEPSAQRALAGEMLGGQPAALDRWTTLRVGDTAQLQTLLAAGERPRVPLTEPVVFTVNGRTGTGALEPYLLGMYLGDGCHFGSITCCDDEMREYLLAQGLSPRGALHSDGKPKNFGFVGELRKALTYWLNDQGLSGARAWEKFVPEYVLTASIEYRVAFLQGLMDTDGYVDDRGRCYFTSTSLALAQGVQRLVRSLGGKAWLREKGNPTYEYKGEKLQGRAAYDVLVQLRKSSALFRLSRKKARCTDSWNGGYELMRAVESIEFTRRAEAVCIKVSSPFGLYVGDDYIVTHNTDLACGMALTQHTRTAMFRRVGTELVGIIDRLVELFGGRDGYNGQDKIWRRDGLQIELASVPNLGDEKGHQGRPKDLLVIDEAANFLEAQVRFLMGWVRSTKAGQHSQTLMTFNPPTAAEGRWVVKFFAPWIDKTWTGKKAAPGELRYVGVVPGANGVSRDIWVDGPEPFVIVDGEPVYDFDANSYKPEDIVTPQSRTFIPSRITDNPHLANTGYMAQLQALPEPLRSQMLYGDFEAGMTDDPWQVVPTAWVDAAMARWKPRERKGEMMAMGVDVARGGKDQTALAPRYKVKDLGYESGTDYWFDQLQLHPGKETPDGNHVAGLVIAQRRDLAPILIDVIGVGASPYDVLKNAGQDVYGINVAERSTATDSSGRLNFTNLRSQLWWKMREALDPAANNGIALPPDPELRAELCAPRWKLSGMTIKVESREDIIERVGRSPDRASAVVMAMIDMPKSQALGSLRHGSAREQVLGYNPMDHAAPRQNNSVTGYNPLGRL